MEHQHIRADDLELYVLGRVSDDEAARIEEHLLICQRCRRELLEVEGYVAVMKRGLAKAGGVVEVHVTSEGVVTLRVQEHQQWWQARIAGRDLDWGRLLHSCDEAVRACRATFLELFPEHRCTHLCQHFDPCDGNDDRGRSTPPPS